MSQDRLIEDIIAQLDQSIKEGVGHVNVSVNTQQVFVEKINKNDETLIKKVKTLGCLDGEGQNLACKTPTLMEGLDTEKEDIA